MTRYLEATEIIDHDDDAIETLAKELAQEILIK